MSVVLLSFALALVLFVAIVAGLTSIRLRKTLDRRVAAAASQIAGEWASRSELAASLDPGALVDRALSEVAALPCVDASLMLVDGETGTRAVAVGLTAEEADRLALHTPTSANLRAIEFAYRYRLDDVGASSARPRTGVVVPLRAEGDTLGSLAALSHSSTSRLPEETLNALEAIARRAGPALLATRRFMEAKQLAELDSLTGLNNRRSFHESLEREIARARRYERRLALVVLDLDNFKRINDSLGHLSGDAVLAEIGRRIRDIVRTTDIAARFGGDEFAIILPESGRADAELLADRIVGAVAAAPVANAGTLDMSAGVSEMKHDDTGADLFERADHALYRAKAAGKAQTVAS